MHKPLATDFRPLLRHFSITDGLIRGTGLVNYVICNAAFVLLPGFGAHGLLISTAIQDTIAGLVEIPFGWIADRFGWAKAVIIAYALKCFVPLLIVLAVYFAWIGKVELAWVCLTCEAVLDAFVAALQNGAYEAAYSEWYRVRTRELARDPSESPPPLFIRSLRYSMWIRVLIPVAIIGFIMVLQTIPGFRSIDIYTITFIALAFIFVLRVIGLARICLDLAPLRKSEKDRIVRQKQISKKTLIKESLRPIREHFAAFSLYTLACFQYGLSATYVAGTAMKEMSRLNLDPSHGWLASVGLAISVYVLDYIFWVLWGYRIHKGNASLCIRNLGLTLLLTCLLTTSLHTIEAHPLFQSLSFAVCVLCGTLCAGAIKRFFSSHIREWLKSDYIATWFSIAESIAVFSLGILGALIVYLDNFVPNVMVLLIVSLLIAVGIIYYLCSGSLKTKQEPVPLKLLLAKSFLGVTILIFAAAAVSTIHIAVTSLGTKQNQREQRAIARLQTTVASSNYAELHKLQSDIADLTGQNIEPCLIAPHEVASEFFHACENFSIAAKDYSLSAVTRDRETVDLSIRFNRTSLARAALTPFLIVLALFLAGVIAFYLLLRVFTKRVHQELELLLDFARNDASLRPQALSRFTVKEFKDLAQRLKTTEDLREELTRHRAVAELSARVAHDIRSPLLVFQMLSSELKPLPEAIRVLLRNAIQAVCDISRELLDSEKRLRERIIEVGTSPESETTNGCLVSQIVLDVVQEKQACLKHRPNLELSCDLDTSAYASFAHAMPGFLKSVLSNVLQNSVEAISDSGEINVTVSATEEWVEITVRDNGKGIPSDVLPSLLWDRKTHGKELGNGLGLYNARRSVEAWGGTIGIDSEEGAGATVTVRLRLSPAPPWFVSKLEINENQVICVLDDDPLIHELWKKRFAFLIHGKPSVRLVHFGRSTDLHAWLEQNAGDQTKILLVDQELAEEHTTGIEFLQSIGETASSFLVTHSSDDPAVISKCVELGIGLVPKSLANNLPIAMRA